VCVFWRLRIKKKKKKKTHSRQQPGGLTRGGGVGVSGMCGNTNTSLTLDTVTLAYAQTTLNDDRGSNIVVYHISAICSVQSHTHTHTRYTIQTHRIYTVFL